MQGTQAEDFSAQRTRMVAEVDAMYAETRAHTGLAAMSGPVRRALGRVARHRLVQEHQAFAAYRNHPLPIGGGQTISQPYIVALSTDLLDLQPGDRILEIGTGSGYQAAVLGEIAKHVYSMETIPSLGEEAAKRLEALGYRNIDVRIGDGYKGWPENAPFDGILVTAAAPHVPQALVDQLKPGGRLVIPVGGETQTQWLKVIDKGYDGSLAERSILPVRFVPMVPAK
jgi:protein-L-isoaspartate(D-aspartate) O-methyltransferase